MPEDYSASTHWFQAAARQGVPDFQAFLGFCYRTGFAKSGKEVTDDLEAVTWYRRAAAAGNVPALHNLAVCYCWGRGVNHDYAEAVRLFERLAEQGHPAAQ